VGLPELAVRQGDEEERMSGRKPTGAYTLYGMRASLYTGKARAYLINQDIDYLEIVPGSRRFLKEIVPKIGRMIIPTIETPNGEIVQDSTEIIDFFEKKGLARESAYPTTPRQLAVAHVLELYGSEGLLRPAMHYRWNFPEVNDAFIERNFADDLRPGAPADEALAAAQQGMKRMRLATAAFGVSPETIPLIESAYLELLELLQAHISAAPYLLGGRPSLADYGLIAPLYAHLARDPHPSTLMKQRAHRVFRWTERMNSRNAEHGGISGGSGDFFANDGIPDSLKAILRHAAEDLVPETQATARFFDDWLEAHQELEEGAVLEGGLGLCRFEVRGRTINALARPYRIFLVRRLQDACDAMPPDDRRSVEELLQEVGLGPLLEIRTQRRVERANHREVLGPPAA
jgi:glutathione S-transferase